MRSWKLIMVNNGFVLIEESDEQTTHVAKDIEEMLDIAKQEITRVIARDHDVEVDECQ